MENDLDNREADREDRITWNPGDVIVYKSLEEFKRAMKAQGKTFIPSRSEKQKEDYYG